MYIDKLRSSTPSGEDMQTYIDTGLKQEKFKADEVRSVVRNLSPHQPRLFIQRLLGVQRLAYAVPL